jgi:ABC-2 type transport system ATP-binding protein
VLFSSHFLDDVERVSDRIALLANGRLIVDAPTDELRARVSRHYWLPGEGQSAPPPVKGLLRAERRRQGFELTLCQCDETALAELQAGGARLGPPAVVTIEDLFLALTRDDARILPLVPKEASA